MYNQKTRILTEMNDWLQKQSFTHLVTFNFNREETFNSARKAIGKWHAGVDRQLFGKHFNKMSPEERTLFLAFFEHPNTNLHAHALLRTQHRDFTPIAKAVWAKLVPSGSLHVSGDLLDQYYHQHKPSLERLYASLDTAEGRDYATRYTLKEQWKDETYDHFLISSEFLPK